MIEVKEDQILKELTWARKLWTEIGTRYIGEFQESGTPEGMGLVYVRLVSLWLTTIVSMRLDLSIDRRKNMVEATLDEIRRQVTEMLLQPQSSESISILRELEDIKKGKPIIEH